MRPPEGQVLAPADSPRWLVIVAWSTGLAGLYAMLSLLHAALIERNLSVDVGFGRSLAFWIGAIYLLLLCWGFVPARPAGRFAARPVVLAALAFGVLALVVCGTFTGLWLASHWVASVGGPVTVSIAVLAAAAVGVLWLAGREDRVRGS